MEIEIVHLKRFPKSEEINVWVNQQKVGGVIKKLLSCPKIASRAKFNPDVLSFILVNEKVNPFTIPRKFYIAESIDCPYIWKIFRSEKLYKNIPATKKFGKLLIRMSFFLVARIVFAPGFRWVIDNTKIDLSKFVSDTTIPLEIFLQQNDGTKKWIQKNIHPENITPVEFGGGLMFDEWDK